MSNRDKSVIAFKVATLGVLLVCLIAAVRSTATIATLSQAPKILVQSQADMPLRISSPTLASSSNPLEPRLDYFVINISEKAVNAYAIRNTVSHADQYSEGVALRSSASANSLLNVGQSERGGLAGGVYPEPVTAIELTLDFVEFADGTTWGEDKLKSAERLSGQRAGAQAEADRLLKVVKERGVDAVLQSLATSDAQIAPPPRHTPEWNDGFREGINFKRGRLKRAHAKSGKGGIELELQEPFDVIAKGSRK